MDYNDLVGKCNANPIMAYSPGELTAVAYTAGRDGRRGMLQVAITMKQAPSMTFPEPGAVDYRIVHPNDNLIGQTVLVGGQYARVLVRAGWTYVLGRELDGPATAMMPADVKWKWDDTDVYERAAWTAFMAAALAAPNPAGAGGPTAAAGTADSALVEYRKRFS